jgi:large conductance mechanosensitive channel
MWSKFREFVMRGNVIDLATGVILGASFGKITTSLVEDVLMPPIGLVLGQVDFSNLFINLSGRPAASVAEAKAAGVPVVAYGQFINTVIDFLIVAFVVFLLVQSVERVRRKPEAAAPVTRECPYCAMKIPAKAVRCPECTSQLGVAPGP